MRSTNVLTPNVLTSFEGLAILKEKIMQSTAKPVKKPKKARKKKVVKKLLLGLTVISLWSGVNAASKSPAPSITAEDVHKMMILSKKLESKRAKVGVCLRRIAIQMAALLDSSAETSNSTVKETIQELSDRLRQIIGKYELAKNVTVIVYYKDCGVKDVTDDFIAANFPYPVKE